MQYPQHPWNDTLDFGNGVVEELKRTLLRSDEIHRWMSTQHIIDVQEEPHCRRFCIDLLWFVKTVTGVCCVTMEVKGDRNAHTGNFFFETVSVLENDSPGAFVSCQAEYYVYCFLPTKEIYFIPLMNAKPWFQANLADFQEKRVHSNRDGRKWTTLGRLVPIRRLLAEVEDVRKFTFIE